MTKRSGTTWAIFAGCLLLVGLALFWVTREALDLERREAAAQEDARRHEAIRLALWRMDSAFAPIIAQEAARAPAVYGRPTSGPPHEFEPFRITFSIDAAGVASSPEIDPFVRQLWPARFKDAAKPESAPVPEEAKADRFEEDKNKLAALAAAAESRPAAPPPPPRAPRDQVGANSQKRSVPMPQFATQADQSKEEYLSRAKMAEMVQNLQVENALQPGAADERRKQSEAQAATRSHLDDLKAFEQISYMIMPSLEPGPLKTRWLRAPDGRLQLFLVRTVTDRSTSTELLNGIWCDWNKLERWLVANAGDRFPESRLVPAPDPTAEDQAAMLATIPARFVAGELSGGIERPASPTRLILLVAWVAALAAIAAVGLVLRAAMSLGERRGRFVSAVTHELRTPLTTFRMYSQMLADGMVPASSHPEYLATLKQESERLSRVVESVLLYSRLEEGRGGAHREVIGCDALLARIMQTLKKRAADGGMTPEITVVVPEDARVEVDVQAVEQILLNLVDNACKYAAPADPRLELECRVAGRFLEVRCRDRGPGIPVAEREAIFLPFRRGERDAAGTTPGVGLGLSLARGLARALGGDLDLELTASPGAGFVLRIPRI
jgi:signal transduction histidine kinase